VSEFGCLPPESRSPDGLARPSPPRLEEHASRPPRLTAGQPLKPNLVYGCAGSPHSEPGPRSSGSPTRQPARSIPAARHESDPVSAPARARHLNQETALAGIHRFGCAEPYPDPRRFVDVPAGEPGGLLSLQKPLHRAASAVPPERRPVERRLQRRAMADQDQRLQAGEPLQPLGQLLFGVLARRVEWRRRTVSQPCNVPAIGLEVPPVQCVQPMPPAEELDLGFMLMIARQDPHFRRPPRQHRSQRVQPAPPGHQVACGHIQVRLLPHQRVQRCAVAVNVGKDENPHDLPYSRRAE